LKTISAVLSELAMLDGNLKPVAQAVREATIELEDSAFDLGRYLDRLDLDPSELAEVHDRLNTINRILNKYGETVPLVLEYRAELGRKIAELERAGDDLASLQSQIEPLTRQLESLAGQLTSKRRSAAGRLAPLIEKHFAQLGMDKARFQVELRASLSGLGPSGGDEVEFMVQTNPGLPACPLRKIASGGELSRIMLAIKGVLSQGQRVSVLVFDEIDANVGGRLGLVIGAKLRELAGQHQVLCITHLPQIAAFADRHLTVRKTVADHQTHTVVRLVEGPQRLEELAEMIGGQHVTDTTRAQAGELLAAARASSGRRRKMACWLSGQPVKAKPDNHEETDSLQI
jgi:DNA repair protein RecN (Recombination protein N)